MTPRMRATFAWLRAHGFMIPAPSLPQTKATKPFDRSLPSMKTFESWDAVLDAARVSRGLWYHAPLDLAPVWLSIVQVYKNRKIRLRLERLAFTADAGHLDRFRKET